MKRRSAAPKFARNGAVAVARDSSNSVGSGKIDGAGGRLNARERDKQKQGRFNTADAAPAQIEKSLLDEVLTRLLAAAPIAKREVPRRKPMNKARALVRRSRNDDGIKQL